MDKDKTVQNLKDAGCEQSFIDRFLKLERNSQLNLLAKHRSKLLDKLHDNQKQIDCLDYLIFNIKNYNIFNKPRG